jgi:hypothetical protein
MAPEWAQAALSDLLSAASPARRHQGETPARRQATATGRSTTRSPRSGWAGGSRREARLDRPAGRSIGLIMGRPASLQEDRVPPSVG